MNLMIVSCPWVNHGHIYRKVIFSTKQKGEGLRDGIGSLKSEPGRRRASRRIGRFSEHLLLASQACDGKAMQKSSAVKERILEMMHFGSK